MSGALQSPAPCTSISGVNELIIPNYKQTWANIWKIADAPEVTRRLTFKSQAYVSA